MTNINEQIKALAAEQKRAWETEGKPLADIASSREFTVDEREKYERLERAYNSFDERINALVMQRDTEARALEWFTGNDAQRAADAPTHADGIRAALRGEERFFDVMPTAADVRGIMSRYEERALSVGVAAAGGNTVGKTYLERLIEPLRMFSGVWAAGAFPLITGKGDDVTLPRLTSFGSAAGQAEGTQLTGTDPAFDQVTFRTKKYGDFRGVSTELVEDSLVDIEGLTTRIMGENVNIALGADLINGSGTNAPRGIANATTLGQTGSTGVGGAPSWDNLIDLQESVLAPYQANASWVLSNGAVASIRKQKDNSGRYLWEPNGQSGAPSELLGQPVRRDPFVDAPGVSKKSIFYGDFSRYWVRLVGAVRVERSDHALFGSDQVAFRAVLRADGNIVDLNAVKHFVGGAS